jgi:hypothetical protein
VQLISVVSTKVHGSAGTFDVDLPLAGNPGIECRSGGTNGDYTLVLKFANTLISAGGASLASGTGSISNGMIDSSDGHNYIVSLAGVTNAQYVAVSLSNVTDSAGNFSPAVAGQMGVLLGDVNASGRVDAADVSLVRQQTLQPVTSSNFRNDINASGRIDAADVSIARQQTLTSLPPVRRRCSSVKDPLGIFSLLAPCRGAKSPATHPFLFMRRVLVFSHRTKASESKNFTALSDR